MEKLFVDDFVRNKGFETTEDYLRFCHEERIPPRFKSARFFSDLYSHRIIKPGFIIRVYSSGGYDEHYEVTDEGKLEGVIAEAHSGKEGVFEPEKMLNRDKLSFGWTIEDDSWIYWFRKFLEKQGRKKAGKAKVKSKNKKE